MIIYGSAIKKIVIFNKDCKAAEWPQMLSNCNKNSVTLFLLMESVLKQLNDINPKCAVIGYAFRL